jgi:two-component system, NtrC family, sensor kinase
MEARAAAPSPGEFARSVTLTNAPVVLIVDDSLTVRLDLSEAFVAGGFAPLACGTAQAARDHLAAHEVALLVIDVSLPDADGIEFLKELRERPGSSDLKVLLLATEADVNDRARGLRTGADEFVSKPYDRGYVVAKARELVRSRIQAPESSATTVLVIDDSVTYREALRAVLTAAGHLVLVAATGEEGLRIAADSRPDAILVDGLLPGIDGSTVVRRLRLDAALRRTPCLLLTASDSPGAELRALDAGADGFVRKQEELGVILARLASVMRGSTTARDQTASLLAPKRILAVDDDITYLEQLAGVLRDEGYDVVQARSGEEALELLSIQPVDCILLDLTLPGLSGQETCARIKAAVVIRDIPLILLSATEDRRSVIEGLATGADDYIAKSSEFEVLKARVSAQLRRRQLDDESRRMRAELFQRELEATETRAAREIAEARAALVAELERKNKDLEAFSYSVSHDLRAPLRSIDGFSHALLQDYNEVLDARGRDYLARVRASAQRMGELIDDLLDLSRVGRAELVRGPVDLSILARRVAAELARREPERSVAVEIAATPMADADTRLLLVALENLIGNAWKFSAKTPQARITFGAELLGGITTYFVRDNGDGFNMDYAHKLFQPFQRLHTELEFAGTGIGLATVQRIVDRHDGRIWVDAAPGAGATFFFTLTPSRG